MCSCPASPHAAHATTQARRPPNRAVSSATRTTIRHSANLRTAVFLSPIYRPARGRSPWVNLERARKQLVHCHSERSEESAFVFLGRPEKQISWRGAPPNDVVLSFREPVSLRQLRKCIGVLQVVEHHEGEAD